MQRLYPQLAGDLIDAKGVNLILERGVYSHNCNKLNKTNHAFGEDIKRIMKNSSMSESSLELSWTAAIVSLSLRCIWH